MCGNNNNNAGDDFSVIANGYAGGGIYLGSASQITRDLWTIDPSNNAPAATVIIPSSSAPCVYTRPNQTITLFPPAGQDITQLLPNVVSVPGATESPVLVTVGPLVTVAPAQALTAAEADTLCRTQILVSQLYTRCVPIYAAANRPANWVESYITSCAMDLTLLGKDLSMIASAMSQIETECGMFALQQSTNIGDVSCPSSTGAVCSGSGTCADHICTCVAPFSGPDCSLNAAKAPEDIVLAITLCDTTGKLSCPVNYLSVSGSNFISSGSLGTPSTLSCRFGTLIVEASYMGSHQVFCNFPTGLSGVVNVSVSNNKITWSEPKLFRFYNSDQVLCSGVATCVTNPTSCYIDGVYRAQGDHNFLNACQVCWAVILQWYLPGNMLIRRVTPCVRMNKCNSNELLNRMMHGGL